MSKEGQKDDVINVLRCRYIGLKAAMNGTTINLILRR